MPVQTLIAWLLAEGTAAASSSTNWMAQFFAWLVSSLNNFLSVQFWKWIFSPQQLVELGFSMVGGFVDLIAWAVSFGGADTAPVVAYLQNIGNFLQGPSVGPLVSAGFWLISPVISPALLVYGLLAMQLIWGVSIAVRLVLAVKSWVWAGG